MHKFTSSFNMQNQGVHFSFSCWASGCADANWEVSSFRLCVLSLLVGRGVRSTPVLLRLLLLSHQQGSVGLEGGSKDRDHHNLKATGSSRVCTREGKGAIVSSLPPPHPHAVLYQQLSKLTQLTKSEKWKFKSKNWKHYTVYQCTKYLVS